VLAVIDIALAVITPVAKKPPPLRAVLLRKITPVRSALPGLKGLTNNPPPSS
jgi:hypothetical protein